MLVSILGPNDGKGEAVDVGLCEGESVGADEEVGDFTDGGFEGGRRVGKVKALADGKLVCVGIIDIRDGCSGSPLQIK